MSKAGDDSLFLLLGMLKPFRDFFTDELIQSLVFNILRYVGKVEVKDFEKLIGGLYDTAQRIAEPKNLVAIHRETPAFLRKACARYRSASDCVVQSLTSLSEAEELIQENAKALSRGVLDFRGARQSLASVQRVLAEVEADHTAAIHPALRTDAEKRLAEKSRWKFGHPHLSIRKNSAQLRHEATKMLEKHIQRFSRGRVPSNHIDRFISTFFWEVLRETVTDENVKTMRLRLKAKHRKQRQPAPDNLDECHQN